MIEAASLFFLLYIETNLHPVKQDSIYLLILVLIDYLSYY
jgi:hypothetical protein